MAPELHLGQPDRQRAAEHARIRGSSCMQTHEGPGAQLTKMCGAHTFKAGYQSQNSMKLQNLGTQTPGALPVEGAVNLATTATTRSTPGSGSRTRRSACSARSSSRTRSSKGDYVYHNKDFYLQDNWKVTNKLTLDYGMRFTHHGPQYDDEAAVLELLPRQVVGQPGAAALHAGLRRRRPRILCRGANRVAVNPVTGASLGPGSSLAIGTIVPDTGELMNGIIQAGKGIAKENYTEPALVFGPRVGAAYDITGNAEVRRCAAASGSSTTVCRVMRSSARSAIRPPVRQSTVFTIRPCRSRGRHRHAPARRRRALIYNYNAKIGVVAATATSACRWRCPGLHRSMCPMWRPTTTTRWRSVPSRPPPASCRWT